MEEIQLKGVSVRIMNENRILRYEKPCLIVSRNVKFFWSRLNKLEIAGQ